MPMMTHTSVSKESKGRRAWLGECGGRFRPRSLSPLPRKTPAVAAEALVRESSMVEYLPPPVEVTLEETKKILKLERAASPTPTTTSTLSAPSRPPKDATTPETEEQASAAEEAPPTGGWFSRRRLLRTSQSAQKLQQEESEQQPQEPQPPSSTPQSIQRVASIASVKSQALLLTKPASIPEFLNIREIIDELPPPNLMDDASSVASASSSTLTCSVDHVLRDEEEEDFDEELGLIAATATKMDAEEPVTLDDPVLQTGWWERLWEMIDPEEASIMTHVSDLESVTDEKEVPAVANADDEADMSPSKKVTSWWRKPSRRTEETVPIRPPSRGVMDAKDLALVQFETIQETAHTAPPSIERPPIFFSNVDDDDEEIEKEITKPSSCLVCYLFPNTAATNSTSNLEANNVEEAEIEPSKEEPEGEPVAPASMAEQRMTKETTEMPSGTEREAVTMQDAKEALIEKSATKESAAGPITSEKSDHKEIESTDQDDVANVASTDKQQVDNKESPDASADEKEPADEELEESDAISVLLSKLDRRIFPWFCRTEEEEDEKPLETEQTKKDTPGHDSSRKVRFAEEVKVDDDDEIVERADAHNATKECMLKKSVQPSALGKFLEWLTAIEVSAASLTGTNDALCQPLNKLSDSENPDRAFSCVMDPKIPTEINFLTCNADDSTVLTTDPSFPACGNLKTTVQEKPRPMPKFLCRRDGKVLPILTPPFLRKAPVNKEREKQELEIARAMWKHYKKTKDRKENIGDLKRFAERQRQREEWAAAIAAHRRLRQCNQVNCQCRQEQW